MANYPRQPAPQMYPTQQYPQYNYPSAGYPYQQPYNAQHMMNPTPSAPPSAHYGPPPPYSEYPTQMVASTQQQHHQPMMHGYYHGQQGQYPMQQSTVLAPGLWDSGARFDGVAQPRIPPPPPGVTPNASQMAAMQGHNVVGTQQSENFFSGNRNDGGYTFF